LSFSEALFIFRLQMSQEAAVLRILIIWLIGLTVSFAVVAPALAVIAQP